MLYIRMMLSVFRAIIIPIRKEIGCYFGLQIIIARDFDQFNFNDDNNLGINLYLYSELGHWDSSQVPTTIMTHLGDFRTQ